MSSVAGMNLKVAGTDPARKCGGTYLAQKFFGRAPLLFFGSKSTISRFGERFRDGQYSFASFLFAVLLLTVPPLAQPFVKVRGHVPTYPLESAPLPMSTCQGVLKVYA